MIYQFKSKWWQRPLSCLLGFHAFYAHPSTPMGQWRVCNACHGEKARQ
jgi:hypothetical protein